jgi:hypothetical protein
VMVLFRTEFILIISYRKEQTDPFIY